LALGVPFVAGSASSCAPSSAAKRAPVNA
jgi:hypothetical protein